MKNIIVVISLFIIAIGVVLIIPSTTVDVYIKASNLYISEVMASNDSAILDDYNEYSDYIELYNGYDYDINLEDYYLSDDEFDPKKWLIPSIKIKSKEYLIIYASGKDTCNLEKRICHTSFKLSSSGETLMLLDKNGNIISKIKYPSLGSDLSYGYNKNKYVIFDAPTPGVKNSDSIYKEKEETEYNLFVTEYMTHNNRSVYDSYGNYYDWVEIYNSSDLDANLKGLYISDDINNLKKHKFSDVIIPAKSYKILYFSGDATIDDNKYIGFKLSDNDDGIILSNGVEIVDSVNIVVLKDDVSYGVIDGKWKYFLTPTPGRINNTASFDSLGGTNGSS